jgi:hypothetical protein
MNLTIIPIDNTMYIDGGALNDLDLSSANIPENVHALQWKVNLGWIEFKDNPDGTKPKNQVINDLPTWATVCTTIYNNKLQTLQAEQKVL